MTEADATLVALYQPRIRELAARVRSDRRLSLPDVTVTRRSPVCGSTLTLDMRADGDILTEIGWKARACTLGMASLGIVSLVGAGQTCGRIAEVGDRLEQTLHGKVSDFPAPWEDLSIFAAAREYPSRFGSILLPFQTIAQGFDDLSVSSVGRHL